MIIGIDGNEANITHKVGVNVYAFELLKNLWKLQGEWKSKHKLIVYLKEKPLIDMPNETQNFRYKVIPGQGVWILTKLMPNLLFDKDRPDIFFSPSHYTVPFATMPRICSIMDLGYLKFSGQFKKIVFWQLKWWTAISIFVSKRIIAISNATKNDIVRHYTFAKSKTYVTYLGYEEDKFNLNISDKDVRRVRNKYTIVDDYILYIGTLKPSKNIEGLIKAFSKIVKKYSKLSLVIAGKKGWMYDPVYKIVEDLGLEKRIRFTDFVPEEDKPGLIKGAKLVALASFWEGFGLDMLNAMASGIPVVSSNVGSLPEVVGKAGTLVDPNSPQSIADGLEKVLSMNKTDYNRVVQLGLEQANRFSWEECARETLKILENVQR